MSTRRGANSLADGSTLPDPVDISANASVSDNVVTVSNWWLDSEAAPHPAGKYLAQIVLQDNTGTVEDQTFNYIWTISDY